jgi:hypothetical protein
MNYLYPPNGLRLQTIGWVFTKKTVCNQFAQAVGLCSLHPNRYALNRVGHFKASWNVSPAGLID